MPRTLNQIVLAGSPARAGLWDLFKAVVRPTNPAWLTVLASIGLSLIGVYGIDLARQLRPETAGAHFDPIAVKQLQLIGLGVITALLIALIDYRWLSYIAIAIAVFVLGLLVFLMLPGVPESIVRPRNGARSWINLGVFDIQPSELAKIAFVLILANYLRFRDNHRRPGGLIPPAIIAFIPIALITLHPDLGSAMTFVPALFAMLLAAGARKRHLIIIVAFAALAAPLSYPLLKPHQQQRINGLLAQIQGNKRLDQDINFQPVTAQSLVGAGGINGATDERSRALVHFSRLPERHTDMIYSVLVNRFGLAGGAAIIGLYGLWIAGALLTAAVAKEPFGRLIVVGLAAFVATQAIVNISMNVGLAPIVGITLPFVSYGGSSMIASWMMVGLVFSVSVRQSRLPQRKSFEYSDDD
ncbi:MAG: FtsW/RodA/SpoVE family cell cycle protein [Phycisphaerales bacterium]|nr:rod shape-determining protein RodA [Planctomycetota bacterium]